jgi:serine phosphatase RsbU (regulator of sigma subunit)
LIVEKEGKLNVEAVASAIQEEARFLHLKLVNESPTLTNEVLHQVADTLQSDTFPDYRIVTPISKKGKNLGYLYLENPSTRDTFNYNQREILQMLASQAAISIENANLYARIEERTREVEEEKDKLEQAKVIIEQKNEDITASIRYARRIQEAVFPEVGALQKNFPNSFILFRPKDIVSGDFYWFSDKENTFMIAAADCTGHGVPGGFMSVMASNFMNQIVNEDHLIEPAEVVARLNNRIRFALKQDVVGGESADGMDMALCAVNVREGMLQFCGAKRPLILYRGSEVIEYRGDKQSIGGRSDDNTEPYEQNSVKIESSNRIYLFSDGFTDQFGGDEHKKYGSRRFRDFLDSLQGLSMHEQGERLGVELDAWRGSVEQTDDILVVGLQV